MPREEHIAAAELHEAAARSHRTATIDTHRLLSRSLDGNHACRYHKSVCTLQSEKNR
jgi:hypothetical protein